MSQEIKTKLRKIGFSNNEAIVYVSLAKLGSSKAGNISKHSELDRSSVYNALKSLIQKGLVSYVIIGKIKWFQCSNPRNIKKFVENKLEVANEVIPSLDSFIKEKKLKENVRLFKGIKGIKTVFEDILANANENLVLGSEGQFSKTMPFFARKFTDRMKRKGIKVKSIIRTRRNIRPKSEISDLRKIPMHVESPVVTNIYGNKIAIIIWSETPEAILIENKKAADAYKDYFSHIWKHAGN